MRDKLTHDMLSFTFGLRRFCDVRILPFLLLILFVYDNAGYSVLNNVLKDENVKNNRLIWKRDVNFQGKQLPVKQSSPSISRNYQNKTKKIITYTVVQTRVGEIGDSNGTERCECVLFYQCDSIDVVSRNLTNQTVEECQACCRLPNEFGPQIGVTSSPVVTGYDPQPASEVSVYVPPSTSDATITTCRCVSAPLCSNFSASSQSCLPSEICCNESDIYNPDGVTHTPTGTSTPHTPATLPTPHTAICGVRTDKQQFGEVVDTRVVLASDDAETKFAEFPWMAIVLKTDISSDGHQTHNVFQCGASIIHPSIILTAAHCLMGLDISLMKIRVGEYNAYVEGSKEPLPHQDRTISRVIIHPEFHSGALFNDFGIVIVNEPFTLNDNVNTICLPSLQGQYDQNNCIATGWGKNSYGQEGRFQTTLKKVPLSLVPRDVCQQRLVTTRLGKYFKLHSSFICAGGVNGMDTCQGDGGGPLICAMRGNINRFVQVGIVSWGIGCGAENIPGVYASVEVGLEWISSQINAITSNLK